WLRRLEVDHENLRVALQSAIDEEDADHALRFGSALFRFWEQRRHMSEGREASRRALALAGGDPAIRAEVQRFLGVMAWRQGDHDDARAIFEICLEGARAQDSPAVLASVLTNLGLLRMDSGDPMAGRVHCE